MPILSNPKCDFINLQFGKFDEELLHLKSNHGISIRTIKDIDNYNDIEGLAALINCLDLVITIQNSTAHLSGALGKNTWLMLVNNARWHWLKNESKFKCPCHGSGFRKTGINFEGPAPRPLERFRISLANDGQILIDKTKKYAYEKGQWSDPESYLIV